MSLTSMNRFNFCFDYYNDDPILLCHGLDLHRKFIDLIWMVQCKLNTCSGQIDITSMVFDIFPLSF